MFHPFYVKDESKETLGNWVAASNLKKGDELLTEDGKNIKVSEVRVQKLDEEITVYNLEITEVHTYYVAGGVLVHNACADADAGGSEVVDVKLSRKKYPESAQHIEEAIKEGQPDTLTIDRGGASARRKASLQGVDTVPGLDRDEYPPAMSMEGGSGASVKLINPSDNRGSGSSISGQLRKYPNGTKYRIIITDED